MAQPPGKQVGDYSRRAGGMYDGTATWKTGWQFLNKLNTQSPSDPATSGQGVHPGENED